MPVAELLTTVAALGCADEAAALGAPLFVLVGGVPGAGKSTALAALRRERADVHVLDPDTQRAAFGRVLGRALPYPWYRPLVHLTHAWLTVLALLRGPAQAGGPLLVHDPATRPHRSRLVAALARSRGWVPVLVMVDAAEDQALAGQYLRGRVVRSRPFARHVARWAGLRGPLSEADRRGTPFGGWLRVRVTDRAGVLPVLREVTSSGADVVTLRTQGPFGGRRMAP